MSSFTLEIREPVGPQEGGSASNPFEWRIIDVQSRQVVLSGAESSRERAVQVARAGLERLRRRTRQEDATIADLRDGRGGPTRSLGTDLDVLRQATGDLTRTLRSDLEVLRKVTSRQDELGPPSAVPAEKPELVHERPPDAGEQPSTAPPSPMELVRSLLTVVDDLPILDIACAELIDQALGATGADSAALLLLEDDGVWRVSAGVGLRPLETRAELDETHWLIATVHTKDRPILIDNTDSVRPRLAGAPLASRRSVIAVPLAGVDGLLLIAHRDEPLFEPGDLTRIAELGQLAAGQVADAASVRRLLLRLGAHDASPAEPE